MSTNEPISSGYPNRRRRSGLFWGLILILVGGIFLLQQFTSFQLRNWWAIFILLPAFGSLSTAWWAFQREGRINETVRGSLGGAVIILTVALIFLFGLDWSKWWPLMVLIPGAVVMFNGFPLPGSREIERPYCLRTYRPWLFWNGLGAVFLGGGFLAMNLRIINPAAIIPNWWGIAILIPAVGGLVTAVMLAVAGHGLGWTAIGNLISTSIYAAVGIVALLGISWNLLFPFIIIAVGVVMLVGVFRRG